MYGWRARIGNISATPSDVFPYEFYKIVPEGVSVVQTTLFIHEVDIKNILAAEQTIDNVARQVARKKVDVLILGGSPTTYVKGVGHDQELMRRITEATGVRTISNQWAAMEAMRKLGMRKLAIASPNTDEILNKLKVFLEGNGFEVVNMKGLQILENTEIGLLPPYKSYQWAKEVFLETEGQADGIYIPCAGWPVAANIAKLETDFKVPVVASNQAKIWAALRAVNINESISGYGRLLEEF